MTRDLFFKIMHVVVQYDDYFAQRIDTCAVLGLSISKCVIALWMLAYGISTDATWWILPCRWKYSYAKHEEVCECHSCLFWEPIFKETNSCRFRQTTGHQWRTWMVRNVCFYWLYQLDMEKLSHGLTRPIPRQRWISFHHIKGHGKPKSLDLACHLQGPKGE